MIRPADFGPIYAETDLSRFPVEPWNTASNIIFLIICLVFAKRTKFDWRAHQTLTFAIPILFIGFIGGTVFHATRSHNIWLIMDFVPIFVLAIATSLHFWLKLMPRPIIAALLVMLPFLFFQTLRYLAPDVGLLRISFGYISLAGTILCPAILYSTRTSGAHAIWLVCCVLSFAIAITCRIFDSERWFPMGTHFLWHLFGGLSTYCLMEYVYRGEVRKLNVSDDVNVLT